MGLRREVEARGGGERAAARGGRDDRRRRGLLRLRGARPHRRGPTSVFGSVWLWLSLLRKIVLVFHSCTHGRM